MNAADPILGVYQTLLGPAGAFLPQRVDAYDPESLPGASPRLACSWLPEPTGAPRLSTGMETPLREASPSADGDPAATFERQMLDRTAETIDALVSGAGEPSSVRIPEISFRFLDRRQLRTLLELADRQSLPGGSVVINAGARSDAMYLVLEGTALVVDASSSTPPVARLWPGELFGELSFLGAVPSKSVIAETDMLVDVIGGDVVHPLLAADTAFASGFYHSLAVLVAHRLNDTDTVGGWTVPRDETELLPDTRSD